MDDLVQGSIEWFLAHSSVRASTLKEYSNRLRRCERILGKPLARANLHDLADLKAELRKQVSGPGAVRCLAMFYRVVDRPDLAKVCKLTQRIRRLRPEEVLTPAEAKRLIEHAGTVRDRALVGALWDLGWRVSDVLSVRWGDVTRRAAGDGLPLTFHISFQASKNDVPMENYVKDSASMLEAWLRIHPRQSDETPLLCRNDGSPLTERRVLQVLKGVATRAGIRKRVYAHLFRHSRATYLLRMGLSEALVKQMLGWAPGSQQLSKTYSHLVSGDGYRNLLRAEGYDVPTRESVDRIEIVDEAFLPIVPTTPPLEGPSPKTVPAEVAALLNDPKVQAFVRALAALDKAAPTS